jgi:hypothetical protein
MYKISDPPRFQEDDIESPLKEKYGLTADMKPLVSDIGLNFHLVDRQGKNIS